MVYPFALLALVATQNPAPSPDTPATTESPPPADAPRPLDAPKPAEAPKPPAPNVGFKNGFWMQSDDGVNKLVIHAMMQPRAEAKGSDPDPATWNTRFAIQRAQIEIGGTVFSKDVGYQLKLELGQGFPFLKDAWTDYTIIKETVVIRAGLGKRPFSRQELTGDTRLGFVDRSETNAFFKGGRDIGVSVHNWIDKSPALEYSVGLFGGESDKPRFTGDVVPSKKDPTASVIDNVKETNVNDAVVPTLVGRFGFNQGDVKGYNELDTDGGDLRFAVAGSALEAMDITVGGNKGATRAEVDAIAKFAGFDASGAVFVSTKQTEAQQTFAQEYEAVGLHSQVGYLIANMVHPGVRYDIIDQADGTYLQEITGALTVLLHGQNVAVQVDGTAFLSNDPEKPPTELRSRAQLNLLF